jgi:NADH dehydrogenase
MNSGKELVPKYPKMKGILAALGGRYAVGKVGNIYMKGLPAYVLKQFVLKSYKLPLKFISKRGYDRLLNGG